MTAVRIKGIKRYRSKGKTYVYHRASGLRIKAPFGSPKFFVELTALNGRVSNVDQSPGTVGGLLTSYRGSRAYRQLAPSTRAGYAKIINLLQPLDAMPLFELNPSFVAALRDKIADQRGRRTANFVMAIISIAAEHGRERGLLTDNPVRGVKRVRRNRQEASANRPWSRDECRTVLDLLPRHVALPVALAMFTGLRQGDVLALQRSAIRDGRVWRRTNKTGQEVSLPLHEDLAALLTSANQSDTMTIATNSSGLPWTPDGFRASFGKAMKKLETAGLIGHGLTFHGLRHTVGTMLREITDDLDLIRRWLGQSTMSMAQHYSRDANMSEKMSKLVEQFDPLGSKPRTKVF